MGAANHVVTCYWCPISILSTSNFQDGSTIPVRTIPVASHLYDYAVAVIQVGDNQSTRMLFTRNFIFQWQLAWTQQTDVAVLKYFIARIVFVILVINTHQVRLCQEYQARCLVKHVGVVTFHVVDALEDWLVILLQVHISFYPVGSQTAILVNLLEELGSIFP